MNYMYSLNATGNSNTTLIVNFDVKTDPNTRFDSHPGTRDASCLATPRRCQQLRNYRPKVGKCSSHVGCLVLAAWNVRCQVSGELRRTSISPIRSRARRHRQRSGIWSGPYAMRLWVKTRPIGKAGITVPEIVSAIQAQNTVNPAERRAANRHPRARNLLTRFSRKAVLCRRNEFRARSWCAKLRTRIVRVRDVARIELGFPGLQRSWPPQRTTERHYRYISVARFLTPSTQPQTSRS